MASRREGFQTLFGFYLYLRSDLFTRVHFSRLHELQEDQVSALHASLLAITLCLQNKCAVVLSQEGATPGEQQTHAGRFTVGELT
jgi:hypothetical protein